MSGGTVDWSQWTRQVFSDEEMRAFAEKVDYDILKGTTQGGGMYDPSHRPWVIWPEAPDADAVPLVNPEPDCGPCAYLRTRDGAQRMIHVDEYADEIRLPLTDEARGVQHVALLALFDAQAFRVFERRTPPRIAQERGAATYFEKESYAIDATYVRREPQVQVTVSWSHEVLPPIVMVFINLCGSVRMEKSDNPHATSSQAIINVPKPHVLPHVRGRHVAGGGEPLPNSITGTWANYRVPTFTKQRVVPQVFRGYDYVGPHDDARAAVHLMFVEQRWWK